MILSKVVLSFKLSFAIVPLVMLTASRAKMGELVAPRWLTWLIRHPCVRAAVFT